MMLDFDFISENAAFIAEGAVQTILLSGLSLVMAAILAVVLVAMERGVPAFSAVTSIYEFVIGATPLLLQIFFIFLALPQLGIILSGLWAGVLVLGLNYGARLMEILRGAGVSGLGRGQPVMPMFVTESISIIKDSSLIALIGVVPEIMWRALRVGRGEFRNLETLLIAAGLYWAITLVLSVVRMSLAKGSQASQSGEEGSGALKGGSTAVNGHGGFPAGPHEATRLLCASAVTAGAAFRRRVLSHLREKHKALAPEVGLDVRTIARVCAYMEARERRYQLWLTLLGIFAVLVWLWLFRPLVLLPALISMVIWFNKQYEESYVLAPYFARERFDVEDVNRRFQTYIDPELARGIPGEEQNLIIYEEFSPFVGTGLDLGGWMFAINVSRPKKQEEETQPIDVSELYKALELGCQKLLLPGMMIKDLLFAHGTAIRQDRSILPNLLERPEHCLEQDVVRQLMGGNDFRIRHYQWFAIQDWGNEMVFSLFLRCSLRGPTLFVEVNRFLLTPLADQYHQVDRLPAKNWKVVSAIAGAALVQGPLNVILSPLMLVASGMDWLDRSLGLTERKVRREIEANPQYNYGAANSLRQLMSIPRFSSYFQRLDREMYVRIFDGEILDNIVEFLDDHNVDTSDLKSQQAAILNSGIIIQGGNLEAQSVAVGAGSQAVTTTKPVNLAKPAKKE